MNKYINWLIISLLILGGAIFHAEKSKVEPQLIPEKPVAASFEPLEGYLDALAMCESDNRQHFRIVDSNGWYSYSTFQFQMPTWKAYAAEVFPYAEDEDLENLIWGRTDQRKVAKAMLEDNPENWRHWFNCGKKIQLDLWAAQQ